MGDAWVVNASPVITLAKAGYLHLFDQLSPDILIPEPVIEEILAGPPSDPAGKPSKVDGGIPSLQARSLAGRSNGVWELASLPFSPWLSPNLAGQPCWMTQRREAVHALWMFLFSELSP